MSSFFPWLKKKQEKKSSLIPLLFLLAVVSLISAIAFLSFDFFNTRKNFPPNTFIGKVNVSGLSKEAAAKKLASIPVESAFEPMVFFVLTGESFAYPPDEIGLIVNSQDSVEQAFSLSHRESYLKGLRTRLSREKLAFPLVLDFDEEIFIPVVAEIASKIESIPKDAAIELDEESGAYHISEDLPGRRLNVETTVSECRNSLKEGKNTLALALDYYENPKITEKMLRLAPPVYKLSSYTTYYGSHDSPNRIHNIRLIASWVNNTIILPDEEYSLLKAIGSFTPDRGFKEAYVITEGALVPQYGGGTCQIGTTLYNAIALADIEVLSRRNHSFYFNIYPLGRDATVYPGSADFRFKNNTGKPILIKAKATYKLLKFSVYGTPDGKKVEFSEPEVFLLTSQGYARSTKWAAMKGNSPFRTIVTRKVFDKTGAIMKEEKIKSFYKLYGEGTNVPILRRESR